MELPLYYINSFRDTHFIHSCTVPCPKKAENVFLTSTVQYFSFFQVISNKGKDHGGVKSSVLHRTPLTEINGQKLAVCDGDQVTKRLIKTTKESALVPGEKKGRRYCSVVFLWDPNCWDCPFFHHFQENAKLFFFLYLFSLLFQSVKVSNSVKKKTIFQHNIITKSTQKVLGVFFPIPRGMFWKFLKIMTK